MENIGKPGDSEVKMEISESTNDAKARKQFNCNDCGKVFSYKHTLNWHIIKVHEENFQCNICNSSFSQRSQLNVHIESVHRGMKPFKCNECGKGFSHNHTLNKHIKSVHERKKPFKCNDCGTFFSQMHCGYSVSMLHYILAKITLTTKFTLAKNL